MWFLRIPWTLYLALNIVGGEIPKRWIGEILPEEVHGCRERSLEVRRGVDKRGNQRNKIVKDGRIWCSMYEK